MQTHILTETRTEIIAFAENPKQTHAQSARMTGNMGALHTHMHTHAHTGNGMLQDALGLPESALTVKILTG